MMVRFIGAATILTAIVIASNKSSDVDIPPHSQYNRLSEMFSGYKNDKTIKLGKVDVVKGENYFLVLSEKGRFRISSDSVDGDAKTLQSIIDRIEGKLNAK